MLKKIGYLIGGVILAFLAIEMFALLSALQKDTGGQGFFSVANPVGIIVIMGAVVLAGFYFLKAGVAGMKTYFK